MKEISLTKGAVAIVDDEDYEELNSHKWYLNSEGYAIRDSWGKGKKTAIRMHRQIANTPKDMDTDHINNNRLDNRKSNLRICTRAQNIRNSSLRADNACGYKGVSLHKFSGLYHARINVEKKVISLGYFKNPKEAAIAYNKAALEYFGEFSNINKV